ncbi:MAG TPA: hypothetical protein VHM24_14190 [Gemmatimonadaceae bacterium]|nr:hypothetical protein [Gemmatimonadaceae bacterium]
MTSSGSERDTENAPSAPRAIVAGHGGFPEGLVSAVMQISGCGEVFLAVSNSGLSGADIEEQLKSRAASAGIRVFFTDLPGGSSTLAVRRLMRTDPGLVLVTGANLATLLEFVFQADSDPREAARRSAEKGRAALAAFGGE